jgi:hypothetical protein
MIHFNGKERVFMKKKKWWILSAIIAVVLIVAVVVVVLVLNSDPTKSPDKAALAYIELLQDAETEKVLDLFPDEVVNQYLQKNQRDRQAWRNTVDELLQGRKQAYQKLGYSEFGEKVDAVAQMSANSLKKLQTKYQDTYGVTVTDGCIVTISMTFQTDRSEIATKIDVPVVQIDGRWYVDFLNLPEYPEEGLFNPVVNVGSSAMENYVNAVRNYDASALLNCYPNEVVDKWLKKNNMTRDALCAQIQTQLDSYKAQLDSENKQWQHITDDELKVIPLDAWYALRQSYKTEFGIVMEDAYQTNVTVNVARYQDIELKNVYVVKIGGKWYLELLNPPALPLGDIFASK